MINKLIPIIILLFSTYPGDAEARIGETIEQCINRYGAPIRRTKSTDDQEEILFKKDTFSIRADFFRGVCDSISYTKLKKQPFWSNEEEHLHLSNGEIGLLMEANSNGKQWSSISRSYIWYQTADYDLEARYWNDLRLLSISSKKSRTRSLDDAYKYSERQRSNAIDKAKTQMIGF